MQQGKLEGHLRGKSKQVEGTDFWGRWWKRFYSRGVFENMKIHGQSQRWTSPEIWAGVNSMGTKGSFFCLHWQFIFLQPWIFNQGQFPQMRPLITCICSNSGGRTKLQCAGRWETYKKISVLHGCILLKLLKAIKSTWKQWFMWVIQIWPSSRVKFKKFPSSLEAKIGSVCLFFFFF